MNDLTITLIQTDLYWEDPVANRAMLEEKIMSIEVPTDLIVLPEMFSTGFTMKPAEFAETMHLTTFKWMRQMALQTHAVVTGTYVVFENGQYFNRLLWMRPDGLYNFYDKRHLFRMGNEHQHYAEGTRKIVEKIKGWRICPLICYDLRFPVWSRNVDDAYDVLLYVANWPAVRSYPWSTLLAARAIENLSYVVGVNRVGEDGNGINHTGDSSVIDFKGQVIYKAKPEACIHHQTISKESLDSFRRQFPAHLDADLFEIK
jgi:omega-amidase